MSSKHDVPPFLRLSPELRQQIYSYLSIAPSTKEEITTINYTLDWPFFDHPSSTTFTPHRLDRCRCPQQAPRLTIFGTRDHIYTRYICHGPEVRFATRSRALWVLQTPGSAFNILRPASDEELEQRPDAGIIGVNKFIYRETLPLLYRNRNFLFLTSICSRGRYQAYATLKWLSRLSPFARSHVTSISLLCQENEEDCQTLDASTAYADLARFILRCAPSCQSLCLNVWSVDIPIYPFAMLFRRAGTKLFVKTNVGDDELYVFSDAKHFLEDFGNGNLDAQQWNQGSPSDEEETDKIPADSVFRVEA